MLVSRSATKGLFVFRLRRDDGYLQLMLRVLRRLWLEHVLRGCPPSPNMCASWLEHQELLLQTVAVRPAPGLTQLDLPAQAV
jgi:hypothetical protein